MEIKKVDDKPLKLHTKKKMKIHIHKRKESCNQSIQVKKSNLHIAGIAGAKTILSQMEGGQEVADSAMLAYGASSPVIGAVSKGSELYKKKIVKAKKRKIKKLEVRDRLSVKRKEKVNAADKKVSTNKYSKGENLSKKAEPSNKTGTSRARKIHYFFDKMKSEENRNDSIVKLAKDLFMQKVTLVARTVLPVAGVGLLILVLLISIITVPVVATTGILYNSPFAIFLPALEDGETVMNVASDYVSEFFEEVNETANTHAGCDSGKVVYVDYEGMDNNPSNYYDILTVYMVKYGVGDTATIMNDTSKEWLHEVVMDMCSYTTITGNETIKNEDGTTISSSVLYVNVSLKSYRDMISIYEFNSEQIEMLQEMMSPEYLALLGYTGNGGGGNAVSELSEAEINAVLSTISDPRAKLTCSYALHRVGYPYSQEYRDSGDYYDCSSLAYYSWKSAGVNIIVSRNLE